MHPTTKLTITTVGGLAIGLLAHQTGLAAQPDANLVAQGKHLVEGIAQCADCHSPRNPDGSFDQARWLQGSILGFKPLMEMPWNPVAPPIAGLPTIPKDEDAVTLLTTGVRTDGRPPLPPMPSYRLSPDEARAVVAYLRALPPSPAE